MGVSGLNPSPIKGLRFTSPFQKIRLGDALVSQTLLQSQANVFLVEDSHSDVVLTKAILKTRNIRLNLEVFRDGSELLEFFEGPGSVELPDLILLDYNLPKVSGVEVLKYLHEKPSLSKIPVVMVTGSEAESDRMASAELGAMSYMIKPLDEQKLEDAAKSIPTLDFVKHEDGWLLYNNACRPEYQALQAGTQ